MMSVVSRPAVADRRYRLLCFHPPLPPVDSRPSGPQSAAVSKKPHKVEEAAPPYTAKQPVKAAPAPTQPRPSDDAAFQRITDKIFAERKELLRKLAR